MTTQSEKPIWGAPERNKAPILDVLKRYAADCKLALEIGSGTGQHAVHFATYLPELLWQCSDQVEYLAGITQWVEEASLPNLPLPLVCDVNDPASLVTQNNPTGKFDLIYSANTLHIMCWETVTQFFQCIPNWTLPDAKVVLYGPFNYAGNFTSESNAAFDNTLKARDPKMGIRNIEDIMALAKRVGLHFVEDIEMPANNRCLVFIVNPK